MCNFPSLKANSSLTHGTSKALTLSQPRRAAWQPGSTVDVFPDIGLTSAHHLQCSFSLTLLWNNFHHRQKKQSHFLPPATTGWHRYVQFTHKQHAKMLLMTPALCSNELTESNKIKSMVQNIWMECLASKKKYSSSPLFPLQRKSDNSSEKQGKRRLCLTSDCVLIFIFNWCIYRSNTKTGAKVSELEQVRVLH